LDEPVEKPDAGDQIAPTLSLPQVLNMYWTLHPSVYQPWYEDMWLLSDKMTKNVSVILVLMSNAVDERRKVLLSICITT
jgi:hypothetical protein